MEKIFDRIISAIAPTPFRNMDFNNKNSNNWICTPYHETTHWDGKCNHSRMAAYLWTQTAATHHAICKGILVCVVRRFCLVKHFTLEFLISFIDLPDLYGSIIDQRGLCRVRLTEICGMGLLRVRLWIRVAHKSVNTPNSSANTN